MSFFGLSTVKITTLLTKYGFMGEKCENHLKFQSMTELHPFQGQSDQTMFEYKIYFKDDFNIGLIPKYWSVAKNVEHIKGRETNMRELYWNHNRNVIDTVPPEDLLVWNVKDGWEPLCK